MQSSTSLDEIAEPKGTVGTLLTSTNLVDTDAFCKTLLGDIATLNYDVACRSLGLTRLSFWLQRDPDAVITMWEGSDIDSILERLAASSDPIVARWRGQLRVYAGPQEAENLWEAKRHRLFSWATDEQGTDSEFMIYRNPTQVEAYRRLARDFEQDPSLKSIVDRVRRRQGFTRLETWHQQSSGDGILLTLFEAHDLKDAMAQVVAEDNELDKQSMRVMRSTFLRELSPPPAAKLLTRWQAA